MSAEEDPPDGRPSPGGSRLPLVEVRNRRRYIGRIADGIQTYWLSGCENDDLREWWETQDAADCALELAHVMKDALESAGFVIARRGDTPEGQGD